MTNGMPETIGSYQVVREIGRGGMGIVYLALDTTLDRQVAIKALPPQLADGLVGEWPSHYRRLLDAGFSNPYQEQGNTRCTLCPESTFRSDDSDPRLIDHILVQGARSDIAVTRFMNGTITIEPSARWRV